MLAAPPPPPSTVPLHCRRTRLALRHTPSATRRCLLSRYERWRGYGAHYLPERDLIHKHLQVGAACKACPSSFTLALTLAQSANCRPTHHSEPSAPPVHHASPVPPHLEQPPPTHPHPPPPPTPTHPPTHPHPHPPTHPPTPTPTPHPHPHITTTTNHARPPTHPLCSATRTSSRRRLRRPPWPAPAGAAVAGAHGSSAQSL